MKFSKTQFNYLFIAIATTEIYTLSLHDALPIYSINGSRVIDEKPKPTVKRGSEILKIVPLPNLCIGSNLDRKSIRLNSSYFSYLYAVFCLILKIEKPTFPKTPPCVENSFPI